MGETARGAAKRRQGADVKRCRPMGWKRTRHPSGTGAHEPCDGPIAHPIFFRCPSGQGSNWPCCRTRLRHCGLLGHTSSKARFWCTSTQRTLSRPQISACVMSPVSPFPLLFRRYIFSYIQSHVSGSDLPSHFSMFVGLKKFSGALRAWRRGPCLDGP